MKKYIISIAAVLLICCIVIGFSVPDRIKCFVYGIAGYDSEDYYVDETPLQKKEIQIDFSTYGDKSIEIYKYDDVSLILDNIIYTGSGYKFTYISHGKSNFETGNIILYNENSEDKYISNDTGKFIYQYSGTGPMENDTIEYYFELYAEDQINTSDLTTMKIDVFIDGMNYVTYERK